MIGIEELSAHESKRPGDGWFKFDQTIIAGAMPPRVIATTARHAPSSGPCPSSRQASARLSRWIWSQLTWNPFSCGRRSVMVFSQVAAILTP